MKRVCYYQLPDYAGDTNNYDNNPKNLRPENISASLCTHIILAAADIKDQNISIRRYNRVEDIERVLKLKDSNPNLKVLLSLGDYPGFRELAISTSNVDMWV